jgi:ABC-type glycerol-3-phosphate transport system substrate-binding protein
MTLTVWASREYYVPPDQFASFTAEHPNVTVEFQIQSNDDMLQQLLRMRDAGQQLPDVLGAEDAFLIEAFVDAGLIESHDEIAADWQAEDPEQYDLLLPLAWDETSLDGVKYGLSVTANFDVLYYNSPWFEEAGLTPPFETLDDVLEAMRALKAARPDGIPLTVQAQAGEGVTTLKTMLSAAGAPFEGAVPDLTSDAGVYVLDWFIQASNEGLLPEEAIAWGEDLSRAAFVSGDAGLILDGFTTAGDFNEAPDFDYPDQWNITQVPTATGTGSEGEAISSARTWAVLAGSEHPDEAALILRYISETENLVAAVFEGSVPMRQTEAINDPSLAEYWPFFTEELKQVYLDSAPVPAGPNAGSVEEILEQLFGEIVVGTDMTGAELAAKYQPQLDEA